MEQNAHNFLNAPKLKVLITFCSIPVYCTVILYCKLHIATYYDFHSLGSAQETTILVVMEVVDWKGGGVCRKDIPLCMLILVTMKMKDESRFVSVS